jgi:predicted phosphodiesterase
VQIAVEGCCHGDLDKIYATLQAMEAKEGRSIDLLICCGDFQVAGVLPACRDVCRGRTTSSTAQIQPRTGHQFTPQLRPHIIC